MNEREHEPVSYQCRHIFTDGNRCASPCLRGEPFCYYHHTTRKPVPDLKSRRATQSTFDLPIPEDRSAIQAAIGEVLRRIASNQLDPRRAGLLLYGLQIASLNLPKPSTREDSTANDFVEEITQHPTFGTLAPPSEMSRTQDTASRLLSEWNAYCAGSEDSPEPDTPQPEPSILPNLQASAPATNALK
jgi:hypothetical protein